MAICGKVENATSWPGNFTTLYFFLLICVWQRDSWERVEACDFVCVKLVICSFICDSVEGKGETRFGWWMKMTRRIITFLKICGSKYVLEYWFWVLVGFLVLKYLHVWYNYIYVCINVYCLKYVNRSVYVWCITYSYTPMILLLFWICFGCG